MAEVPRDLFGGLFLLAPAGPDARLVRHPRAPGSIPDPRTGRALRISTVELARAICPSCASHTEGGFISFEADLRMVFACAACQQLVWALGV
jgi:hypothetical protein